MMSVATTELSRSTQHLIDSRLDTIDRMLLGRVSRQERLEIVREVEAQIFEQLYQRGGGEVGREDVLAVLGRLDPPEAYLPEDDGDLGPVPTRMPAKPRANQALPMRKGDPRIAKASGILGLVALALVMLAPLSYLVAALVESEAVLIVLGGGALAFAFIGSILGIVLSICSRLASVWAVIGLVTAALSVLSVLVLAGLTLLLMG
jgi:hypothetical protein